MTKVVEYQMRTLRAVGFVLLIAASVLIAGILLAEMLSVLSNLLATAVARFSFFSAVLAFFLSFFASLISLELTHEGNCFTKRYKLKGKKFRETHTEVQNLIWCTKTAHSYSSEGGGTSTKKQISGYNPNSPGTQLLVSSLEVHLFGIKGDVIKGQTLN